MPRPRNGVSGGGTVKNRPHADHRVKSVQPVYSFKTVDQFAEIHRKGTVAEFAYESSEIDKFNKDKHMFEAWLITGELGSAPVTCMLLVAPGPKDAMLPKENETCLAIVYTERASSHPVKSTANGKSSASRVDNPCALWGVTDPFWQGCMAFEISLCCNDSTEPPSPMTLASVASNPSDKPDDKNWAPLKHTVTLTPALTAKNFTDGKCPDAIPRDNKSKVWIVFQLRLSRSTFEAEIQALDTLLEARGAQAERLKGDHSKGIKQPIEAQIASLSLGNTANPNAAVDKPLELPSSSLPEAPASNAAAVERQAAAFNYFVLLKCEQQSSLFNVFPHMLDPLQRRARARVPRKLMDRFHKFNEQQKLAYRHLLENLQDGICMVPGGPGAGKTFWNLTVAAALQSKNEIKKPEHESPSKSHNKVLYLLDMNRPLTDVANKMVQVYKDLGLTKPCCDDCHVVRPRTVIRMFCWSYEADRPSQGYITAQRKELDDRRARLRQNLPPIDKENGPLAKFLKQKQGTDSTKKVPLQGFAAEFFKSGKKSTNPRQQRPAGQDCSAKTLDEAAAEFYEQHCNTKYPDIKEILSDDFPTEDLKALRNVMIERLYRDTLANADFIATTPVTASKFANVLFSPSIVIFDEAPHARDLSLLISIASFKPYAWLLTGDHRQTRPFVKSEGYNKYFNQMQVSVMERAFKKNPKMRGLLINHRAYGNLQELSSRLFYNSKMVAAVDPNKKDAIPKEVLYLRENYIKRMKVVEGPGNMVSRLLVVLKNCGVAKQRQSSWFHEGHQKWVMNLIDKLTKDGGFKQVNSEEKGTILVMSPYKLAFTEYGRAIKQMQKRDGFGGCTVEARTVDTAQGHEADVCIIDYVRSDKCTKHLEDPNRMNVAHTRARQLEFAIVTSGMIKSVEKDPKRFSNMAKMIAYCKKDGQYVNIEGS